MQLTLRKDHAHLLAVALDRASSKGLEMPKQLRAVDDLFNEISKANDSYITVYEKLMKERQEFVTTALEEFAKVTPPLPVADVREKINARLTERLGLQAGDVEVVGKETVAIEVSDIQKAYVQNNWQHTLFPLLIENASRSAIRAIADAFEVPDEPKV